MRRPIANQARAGCALRNACLCRCYQRAGNRTNRDAASAVAGRVGQFAPGARGSRKAHDAASEKACDRCPTKSAIWKLSEVRPARLVIALDKQLETINEEVVKASTGLDQAEHELAGKREVLRKRMVDIYKRGSLFDIEGHALRRIICGIGGALQVPPRTCSLRPKPGATRGRIARPDCVAADSYWCVSRDEVTRNRGEKEREASRLHDLESARQRNLTVAQRNAKQNSRPHCATRARRSARRKCDRQFRNGETSGGDVAERKASSSVNDSNFRSRQTRLAGGG